MEKKPFESFLQNRGRVALLGQDAQPFLQNLITNDLCLLEKNPLIYSCLLSPQGKIEFDFFVFRQGERFVLDCEGGETTLKLAAKLKFYKLGMQLDIITEPQTWVLAGNTPMAKASTLEPFSDPRLEIMGWRAYSPLCPPSDYDWQSAERRYRQHRIYHGVPEGSGDMPIGKTTLIECRLDKLNAVSFQKGCYPGQELTARMHYRGQAKKHLYPCRLSDLHKEKKCADLIHTTDKSMAGEFRSVEYPWALALLKDADIDKLEPGIKPFFSEWMTDE